MNDNRFNGLLWAYSLVWIYNPNIHGYEFAIHLTNLTTLRIK